MSEIAEFFSQIDGGFVIFLMIFSMVLAIFHTMLIKNFFTERLPSWLFFVLNPSLIGFGYLIYKPLGGIIFVLLFVSVFVLGLVAVFYSFIKDSLQLIKEEKKKQSLRKVLLKIIGSLALIIVFFALGPYAFPVVIAIVIVSRILPSYTDSYLKLQSILPTSKIRSMAMGLVEVKGKLKKIEYIASPIKSKQCIGYKYIVEERRTDKKGRTTYSTISNILKCNNFYIEDETGAVEVDGEGIDFMWLDVSDRYELGGKRYSQYLIMEGDEMLLIGKADREGDKVIIRKEEIKNVFMMSPANSVDRWNKYQPLLRSFLTVTLIIAIIAMFILVADISEEGKMVHFRLKDILFDWSGLFNH